MNKKIVWIEFGPLQPVFRKFFHLPEILYRLAALFPDKIIFSSQNSLNSNRPYYSSNKHLLVVPLGSPSPVLITKAESFDVLSLSRLEPGKGQDILLKAWPAVIKQVPRAKLIIVGEGDSKYSTYLKKLAPPGVVFTGRVIDQFAYLAACKFLVFPSIWNLEGFGLVITEAFSLGKPVVAFDHPPGNEIVKSGINGLLTPDNDSLAENIVYLLKNPAVLKRLSRGAKLDFETHFRETIYLHKYADTLLC